MNFETQEQLPTGEKMETAAKEAAVAEAGESGRAKRKAGFNEGCMEYLAKREPSGGKITPAVVPQQRNVKAKFKVVQEPIDRLKEELALVVCGRKTAADLLKDMTDELTVVQRTWTPLKQQGFYLGKEDLDGLQRVIDQKTVKITELRSQIAALEA